MTVFVFTNVKGASPPIFVLFSIVWKWRQSSLL